MRVATSLLLTLLLVLTACSDDGDPEEVVLPSPSASAEAPDDEPTPSPSPTASAEAPEGDAGEIDVTTIPDEITPAYVEAVYDEITQGRFGSVRRVLAEPTNDLGALPSGTRPDLERWLAGPALDAALAELELYASDEGSRTLFVPLDVLAPPAFEVLRLVEASDECMVAVGRVDSSQTRVDTTDDEILVAYSFARKPTEIARNPTPWILVDNLLNTGPDGDPNPDNVMLDATLSELESALEADCEGDA